jgi:hypothetical protein
MESKTVDVVEFRDGQRHQWNSAATGWRRWSDLIDGAATGDGETVRLSNLVLLAAGRA